MPSVIDLRGQECPEPLLRAVRVLSRLPPGGSVIFLTDSEECAENIKYLVKTSAIGTVTSRKKGGYIEVAVSRARVI